MNFLSANQAKTCKVCGVALRAIEGGALLPQHVKIEEDYDLRKRLPGDSGIRAAKQQADAGPVT